MPFTEPKTLAVTVTAADIAASQATPLNLAGNVYVNSLAMCLKRLADNKLLPGMEDDTEPQSCVFYAETGVRLMNGNLVSLLAVGVCTAVYDGDEASAITLALENISGIKPSQPYTVQLVKN
jgi:hypothetical protein